MAETALRLALDGSRPAVEAFARARAVWEGVAEGRPAALYVAELTGDGVALGAWQLAGQALSTGVPAGVARRWTGGVAARACAGVTYAALCLRDASVLMACPPGRILNRNVRGTLTALRALKLPAHYFGRDFVSVDGRPGALLGWDEAEDGRVMVELLLSVDASHVPPSEWSGYPARQEDPFRGKLPTTLREAGCDADACAIADALARGHAVAYRCDVVEEAVADAEVRGTASCDVGPLEGLAWSSPREEAIGFVTAGVALDAGGCFERVALGGDLLLRRREARALCGELQGAKPEVDAVGAVLDRLFARATGALEGVRSLRTLQAAVMEAADRAAVEAGDA